MFAGFFWQNPQFCFILSKDDSDDSKKTCSFILALMQKHQRRRGITLSLALHVYQVHAGSLLADLYFDMTLLKGIHNGAESVIAGISVHQGSTCFLSPGSPKEHVSVSKGAEHAASSVLQPSLLLTQRGRPPQLPASRLLRHHPLHR